jgi:hypothetical protein
MANVFESPWLLLIVAIASLVTILLLHMVLPAKKRYWHLLLPIAIALAAFAVDHFIKTDNEKIHYTINKAVKAVESENINILSTTIDRNYKDTFHKNRDGLITHAQNILSQPIIEKIYWSMITIDIKTSGTTASIIARVVFEPDFQQYSRMVLVEANMSLKKQKNSNWLIEKAEITEINKQPFKWNSIKY